MKRTNSQNKSLHKLFNEVSNDCLSHGVDMKVLVEHLEKFNTPATPESIKTIWQAIQFSMYQTYKTSELETEQVDKVFNVFAQLIREVSKGEIDLVFPSRNLYGLEDLG